MLRFKILWLNWHPHLQLNLTFLSPALYAQVTLAFFQPPLFTTLHPGIGTLHRLFPLVGTLFLSLMNSCLSFCSGVISSVEPFLTRPNLHNINLIELCISPSQYKCSISFVGSINVKLQLVFLLEYKPHKDRECLLFNFP